MESRFGNVRLLVNLFSTDEEVYLMHAIGQILDWYELLRQHIITVLFIVLMVIGGVELVQKLFKRKSSN